MLARSSRNCGGGVLRLRHGDPGRARAVRVRVFPDVSLICGPRAGGPVYIPRMLLVAIRGLVLCPEVFMRVRHALFALLSEGPEYGPWLRGGFQAEPGRGVPPNVAQ